MSHFFIASQFHFKSEKNKLRVFENFISENTPTLKIHNKLLGFILWLIGKAKFIKAPDETGKIKIWAVDKKNFEKLRNHLIFQFSIQHAFKPNDIDALLSAVKLQAKDQRQKTKEIVQYTVTEQPKKEEKEALKQVLEEKRERLTFPLEKKIPIQTPQEKNSLKEENLEKAKTPPLVEEESMKPPPLTPTQVDQFVNDILHYTIPAKNELDQFLDLLFHQPHLMVHFLHRLEHELDPLYSNDTEERYELYTFCITKFIAKGGLNLSFFQDLSEEDQQNIYSFCLSKNNDARNEALKKIGESWQMNPKGIFNLIKIFQQQPSQFSDNELKMLFFSMVTSNAFATDFIDSLVEEEKTLLVNFLISDSLDPILRYIENETIVNQLFPGMMKLMYQINRDPDKGVIFLQKFHSNGLFASFFLSLSKPDLLHVETSFKEFINPRSHVMMQNRPTHLVNTPIAIDERLNRCFLGTLLDIFNSYLKTTKNNLEIRNKITALKEAFPWISLEDINTIRSYELFVKAHFLVDHVLCAIEENRDLIELRQRIESYFGTGINPMNLLFPELFFKCLGHDGEKAAKALKLFERHSNMALAYLSHIMETNIPEIIKPVLAQFLKSHKQIIAALPGSFAQFLPRIYSRPQLLLLLISIKESQLSPSEKDKLLQAISGGVRDGNLESVRPYKPDVSNREIEKAFREAGLTYISSGPILAQQLLAN